MTGLEETLESEDALVLRGNSEDESFNYLTGFEIEDDAYVIVFEEQTVLLVGSLEVSRAEEEADVDEVVGFGQYSEGDVRGDLMAEAEMLTAYFGDEDVGSVAVRPEFPVGVANVLRDAGVTIELSTAVEEERMVKDETEIQHLREAQAAVEEAMEMVGEMIDTADVDDDGQLVVDGEVLTSEYIRGQVEEFLTEEHDATEVESVAASGPESAQPHAYGSGPVRVGELVVVDIFPEFESGYYGDMTRTFVPGDTSDEVEDMLTAVEEALAAALDELQAGATGEEVHHAACDVIEEHGFSTLREGAEQEGFIHSTGHAIGLDVHESPRLVTGTGELPAGSVFTVEPGVYIPDVGGVRIEDMIVVTDDGFENLNEMEWRWP